MDSARTLLDGIVDYAGLFPPTAATMQVAVEEFALQRSSPEQWMLGALVLPFGRLDELAQTTAGTGGDAGPWPLSVLTGPEWETQFPTLEAFLERWRGRFELAALEARLGAPDDIQPFMSKALQVEVFIEVPWGGVSEVWLRALAGSGARAKLRCGGVTPDLIPPVERVAAFLRGCAEAGVGVKFTAGLHHPVRSEHPLTYEPDAPSAMMHGFLNVFVAAALVARGDCSDLTLMAVLEETDFTAFRIGPEMVAWRDHTVAGGQLAAARRDFARSFGSCSFSEPVDDLHSMGML